MTIRRALVIGGTRYFGRRLVQKLLDSGTEVTLGNRGQTPDDFGVRVKRLRFNREDAEAFACAVHGHRWDVVFDQVCYSSNNALAACDALTGKTARYVHTSTLSVYEVPGPFAESAFDPLRYRLVPGGRAEVDYGEGKRQAEAAFFQTAPFPVVAVRIPIVLGPDDYTGRLVWHVNRVRDGNVIVIPRLEAEFCQISADGAAEFLHWIGGRSETGPINIASEGVMSMGELIGHIEKATGRRAEIRSTGEPADETPLADAESRVMVLDRVRSLGVRFENLREWLLPLIQDLARRPR